MDDNIKRKDYKQKAKKVVEETTQTTLKVTKTIFIFIFFVIIIVTVVFSIFKFISTKDVNVFLEQIVTLGIGGFWAFFLGYFGWRMGQTIEISIHNFKKKK